MDKGNVGSHRRGKTEPNSLDRRDCQILLLFTVVITDTHLHFRETLFPSEPRLDNV